MVHCSASAFVLASRGLQQGGHARGQSSVIVAPFEVRRDLIIHDPFPQRIRHRAFQPVTDFDPHPPVLDEHEQHRAVVFTLLTDFPGFRDSSGVIFQRRIGLHPRENRDDDLAGIGFLEVFERPVQPLRRGGGHNTGVIVEIISGLRRHDLARQTIQGQESKNDQEENSPE